jgi:hypothetical protein
MAENVVFGEKTKGFPSADRQGESLFCAVTISLARNGVSG